MAPVTLTVVIPVLNGASLLAGCLEALRGSSIGAFECIVVDDFSADGSAEIAAAMGATVIRTERNAGPAVARNLGAACASGDLLVFIDSDVLVHPDTLARIAARFDAEPDLDALIGSYDDAPGAPGFVSQYKNLLNHYVHQSGNPEASTFWSACGAIRRDVFLAAGGFDNSYSRPAIEDIELGCRLRHAGRRIALDRSVQAKHMKQWTLGRLLRSDIFERALPWTRLILHSGWLPNDLNVARPQRIVAVLVWTSAILAAASWSSPVLLALALLAAAGAVVPNRKFFGLLRARKGTAFVAAALPLYFSYYVYSSLAFCAGIWLHLLGETDPAGEKSRAGAGRRSAPRGRHFDDEFGDIAQGRDQVGDRGRGVDRDLSKCLWRS